MIKALSMFYSSRKSQKEDFKVSVLISVYNEQKVIKERIENLARQTIGLSNLEVLVGSDCSDDSTNKILQELAAKYDWLKIFIFNERRGKAIVLNDLMNKARNEILVFTDANTIFEEDAIGKLTEVFNDNSIGGVSGRLILNQPQQNFDKSNEEKRYWEYETLIKKSEGRCGTLIGANGGIFAIRKSLSGELPSDKPVTDDLYLTLSVLQKGRRFTYNEHAIGYEEIAPSVSDELKRKIRFSATNFQTLMFFKFYLNGASFLANYCYWSHKLIRWVVPFILILLLPLNLILLSNSFIFQLILFIQILIYLFATIGFFLSKTKIKILIFSMPYFFIMTNYAIIEGLFKFIAGKHSAMWQSTPR